MHGRKNTPAEKGLRFRLSSGGCLGSGPARDRRPLPFQSWSGSPPSGEPSRSPSRALCTPAARSCWRASPTASGTGAGCSWRCLPPSSSSSSTPGTCCQGCPSPPSPPLGCSQRDRAAVACSGRSRALGFGIGWKHSSARRLPCTSRPVARDGLFLRESPLRRRLKVGTQLLNAGRIAASGSLPARMGKGPARSEGGDREVQVPRKGLRVRE